MIEKVKMYQAVCDRCQRRGVGEEIVAWDSQEGAELEAIDSGWQWIGRKLYCPDCVDLMECESEAEEDKP
jgi:hypothetical protein